MYYINDITIFYIVDSLKQGYNDKFKNIMFSIPYILHLIKNNFYKQEIKLDNFYKLGINKIVGSSDESLLSDKELLKYSIAIALREKMNVHMKLIFLLIMKLKESLLYLFSVLMIKVYFMK